MNIRQKVWTNLLRSRRTIFIGVACLFSALLLAQLVITIARRPGPQPEPNFTLLPNGSSPSLLVGAARPEEIEESQPQQPSMKVSEDAQNCTYPAEYWREYPQAWTVEHITVGRSSFSKEEVLAFLENDSAEPAASLFKQYFAAVLNTILGADPSGSDNVMNKAGEWIATHRPDSLMLPGEKSSFQVLADQLGEFNTGVSGPGVCPDLPSTLIAQLHPAVPPTPIPTPGSSNPSLGSSIQSLSNDSSGSEIEPLVFRTEEPGSPALPPSTGSIPPVVDPTHAPPPSSSANPPPTNPPVQSGGSGQGSGNGHNHGSNRGNQGGGNGGNQSGGNGGNQGGGNGGNQGGGNGGNQGGGNGGNQGGGNEGNQGGGNGGNKGDGNGGNQGGGNGGNQGGGKGGNKGGGNGGNQGGGSGGNQGGGNGGNKGGGNGGNQGGGNGGNKGGGNGGNQGGGGGGKP